MVVTGLESVALLALTQEEVKVTDIGTVAGAPSISTGMLTLLVP
jgi:16S rRNA G527 N7-methylase RsmG